MAIFRRNRDNTFKAKSVVDLETVTAKLDAARETLAAVESEIHSASLPAVLSDDAEAIMAPLRERLRRAQETVTLCEAAYEVAVQAERGRLAAAADAAERARIKRVKELAATAEKAAVKMRLGFEQAIDGWNDLTRVSERLLSHLRPEEQKRMFGGGGDLKPIFANLANLEVARLSSNGTFPFKATYNASFKGLLPFGKHPTEMPPIEEMIRQRLDLGVVMYMPQVPFRAEQRSHEERLDAGQRGYAERLWRDFDALSDTEKAAVAFPPERPEWLSEKQQNDPAPAPSLRPDAYEDDPHIVEMRRVSALAAAGKEPAPPAEFFTEDGFTDLQRQLAVEADEATGATETTKTGDTRE